jgi:aryl-alcohol dehydrogenase-like predicted oxidoreductase
MTVDKRVSPERPCPRVELAPGYSIAAVINGCWQLSSDHGGNDLRGAELMSRFSELVDAGFTTFDCADIYTGVEELIGRFLKQHDAPDSLQVHTKFVPDLGDLSSLDRSEVESIIHRSLRRLGKERLDLVQFHWWDYRIPGYIETLGVLESLRQSGKIRLLGLTNFDCRRVGEIVAAGIPVSSLQLQYSLLDRRPERGMAKLCERHGITLLPYGVLGGGLLSDRYLGKAGVGAENRSQVKYLLMVDEAGGWRDVQQLLSALHEVAAGHGCSMSAVAARWVMNRPAVKAIILGTGRGSHVRENLELSGLELTDSDNEMIENALASLTNPAGDVFELERNPEGLHARNMKMHLSRA